MNIRLENAGKKFNKHWLFRKVDIAFSSGDRIGIEGRNGSGKSTLLGILSGYTSLSEGQITWHNLGTEIPSDSIFKYVSLCSPALSLYDDFTLEENFIFYSRFVASLNNTSAFEFAGKIELKEHLHRQLKFYSSGMRQRVKLGLAILSQSPLLLLDEPTSHLDDAACKWYEDLLAQNTSGRTLVIATNEKERDASICNQWIAMQSLSLPDVQVAKDH
jgi:ABC-type multidrug transport system ATPase subunit